MARHGAAFLLSLTLAGAVPAWIAPAWITPAWAETADQMAASAEAMASALAAAGTPATRQDNVPPDHRTGTPKP